MTVIDWGIISCLSFGLLFSLSGIYFLFSWIRSRKKELLLLKKRPKNKKKRKIWKRQRLNNQKKKRKMRLLFFLSLFLLVLSVGGGSYLRYYQSVHLGKEDKEVIAQSYYLLGEIKKDLSSIQEGADSEKVQEKLKDELSLLVSYTARQPSTSLSMEGQQVLRSYYKKTSEIGTNLYNQTANQLQEKTILEGFLDDIITVQKKQGNVFKLFKINEESINKK